MRPAALAAAALLAASAASAVPIELVSDAGRAVADTYGARVTSWIPAGGGEVFAMARPYAEHPRGEQIHGGLPLYWPWFVFEGPEGCKIHGVTSYAEWKVKERSRSRVVFELDDSEETRRAWPHGFHAELAYELAGDRLEAAFSVVNTGDAPYSCTEGFHPYFRVGDVRECAVTGTDGCRYFTKLEKEKGDGRRWEGDFPCRVVHEKGAGYVIEEASPSGRHVHEVLDPVLKRSIHVEFEGNIKIVVFNSGPDFSKYGGSTDPDYPLHFVCLEGATLYRDRAYTLAPGERHELKATVSVR